MKYVIGLLGLLVMVTAADFLFPDRAAACPRRMWYASQYAPAPQMAVTCDADKPKEKSLYERLGGEDAVKAVVEDVVARAAADPKVNFTRKGTPKEFTPKPEDIAKLKKNLVDLFGMATGGPQKYTGKSMKEAHQGMQITKEEWDALMADFKETLDKLKVPEKEQQELVKIVAPMEKDIVEKKK